jgi:DNA-binding transcriptional regulator YiaG
MKLSEHMARKGLSIRAMAAQLGVTPTQVFHWKSGRRLPDVKEGERIRVITRGRVKATDW